MYKLKDRVLFDEKHRFLFEEKEESDELDFFRICTYAYSFIHNVLYSEVRLMDIKAVVEDIASFVNPIPSIVNDWNHPIELKHSSRISLNQFITAKENIRVMTGLKMSIYETLPIIIACYSQDGFSDDFDTNIEHGSDFMGNVLDMSLNEAVSILEWYHAHDKWITESFGLFKPNRSKGIDMEAHFNAYGWVSFLSMIAKEGVFNVSGSKLNAIDCAKRSRLFDVLYYASEKKESEDFVNFYQENNNK